MKKNGALGKIFAALVLFGLLFFFNSRISNAATTLAKARGELEALRQKNENLKKVQAEFVKIEPDVDKVLAILPDNKSFVDFLGFLETEAGTRGLEIKFDFEEKNTPTLASSTIPPPAQSGVGTPTSGLRATGESTVTFAIELNGSGQALTSFWQKLEQGPYFINIQNVDLATPGGLGGGGNIKLKVKLYVDSSFQS